MAPLPDMVIRRAAKASALVATPLVLSLCQSSVINSVCNAIYHSLIMNGSAPSHLNLITLHTVSQTSIINPYLSAIMMALPPPFGHFTLPPQRNHVPFI
ncbi:hypothetical protein EDB86DRAFT_2952015, partial [Lactarius hatsudake]